MTKIFLTYDLQIDTLKGKNLLIPDEQQAKQLLSQISYFSLIGGYKHPFKNPTTKNYRDGVTFDDIVALYHFDEEIRSWFLRFLLILERSIKTKIAYSFCNKYGEQQSQYLLNTNYNYSQKNKAGIDILISKLDKLANSTKDYPHINHQRDIHKNVPLWVLINAITFGNMSKMFDYLPQGLQSEICRQYPLYSNQLSVILKVLTRYRNICAHSERLFSYNTTDDIPDLPLHKNLQIPQPKGYYAYGKRDLFGVVIALKYLLPNDDFLKLIAVLSVETEKFSQRCLALTKTELLSSMGFPPNWRDIISASID